MTIYHDHASPYIPSYVAEDGGLITQAELAEYNQLKRQKQEIDRIMEAAKISIRTKLENNCAVEPGIFTAVLISYAGKNFSYQKIANLLGEAKANELRDQIEPTFGTYIKFGVHSGS